MSLGGKAKKEPIEKEEMMLGWLFYLFKKHGDAIATSYGKDYGRLEIEGDMSGRFSGYSGGYDDLKIFTFGSIADAIKLFGKEIERLSL